MKLIYIERYYQNVSWGWMRGCRKAEKENKRKKNGIIYGAHNFHVQTDMSSTYLQRRQMYTKNQ